MKRQLSILILGGFFFVSCSKDDKEVKPSYEVENMAFTATMNYVVTSQTVTGSTANVVVDGTGNFTFEPNMKMHDEFVFNANTGSANHKVTFTAPNGDKITAETSTDIGEAGVIGSTIFTGGTGRFAKIKGGSTNVGTTPDAEGKGTWTETGKVTF